MAQHIALLGCGNMGGALLQGWLAGGIEANYTVIEPHALPEKFRDPKITHIAKADARIKSADIVVLAVKPQALKEVCAPLKNLSRPDALIVSIAAGQSLATLESLFAEKQPIIRIMPNTPVAVGKGTSALVANRYAGKTHRQFAETLMACVGDAEWLKDETLFDAVTALSASGPAYIFYLIEVLSEAAQKLGLPADLATRMARRTVIGAAALAEENGHVDAQILRKNVTSPGGTTEAALKILMNGDMQTLFDQAIEAGAKRGAELNA